jgi:hypothetical protein
MKNIVSVIFVLTAGLVLLVGCPAPATSPSPSPTPTTNITGLRFEFYDSAQGYKEIASVTVNDSAHLQIGQWLSFSMPVTLANIAYNGFGSDSSGWTNLDKFRIVAFTASDNQEILLYYDNVKVSNGTNTPLDLNMSSAPSIYEAQITSSLTNDNTLQTISGQSCLEIHVTSKSQYGSICGSIQFNDFATTDLSAQDYTVSFNYYIGSLT